MVVPKESLSVMVMPFRLADVMMEEQVKQVLYAAGFSARHQWQARVLHCHHVAIGLRGHHPKKKKRCVNVGAGG